MANGFKSYVPMPGGGYRFTREDGTPFVAGGPAADELRAGLPQEMSPADRVAWEQPGSGFQWAPQNLDAAVPPVSNAELPGNMQQHGALPVRPGRTFARAAVESGLDAAAVPVKAASAIADYITGNDSTFSHLSGKEAAESLEYLYDRTEPAQIRREERFAEGEIPQAQAAGKFVGEYAGGAPLAALTGRVPTLGPVMRAASKSDHADALTARANSLKVRNPRRAEQLAEAQKFWSEAPEFAEKAESAAKHFDAHPEAKADVARMSSASTGVNRYLRERGAGETGLDYDYNARAARTQRALTEAVRAGHGYEGETVRGLNMPREVLDEWLANGYIRNNSFLSTSANPAYGTANVVTIPSVTRTNPAVVMKMTGKTGVPIAGVSEFPHEQEVLIPRGRNWKIAGQSTDEDGRVILDMQEVDRVPAGVTPSVAFHGDSGTGIRGLPAGLLRADDDQGEAR